MLLQKDDLNELLDFNLHFSDLDISINDLLLLLLKGSPSVHVVQLLLAHEGL